MTKTRFLGLAALALAAGCGSKSSDSTAASGDPSTCGGAIDTAMTAMMDARKKMLADRMGSGLDATKEARMLERSQKVVDGLKGALTTRCTEDKWSPDAIACFVTVKKREDIQACLHKLPKDQEDRATAEIMKTMQSGLNLKMRQGGDGNLMGSAHGGQLQGLTPLGGSAAPTAPTTPDTSPPAPPTPSPAPPAPAPAPAK